MGSSDRDQKADQARVIDQTVANGRLAVLSRRSSRWSTRSPFRPHPAMKPSSSAIFSAADLSASIRVISLRAMDSMRTSMRSIVRADSRPASARVRTIDSVTSQAADCSGNRRLASAGAAAMTGGTPKLIAEIARQARAFSTNRASSTAHASAALRLRLCSRIGPWSRWVIKTTLPPLRTTRATSVSVASISLYSKPNWLTTASRLWSGKGSDSIAIPARDRTPLGGSGNFGARSTPINLRSRRALSIHPMTRPSPVARSRTCDLGRSFLAKACHVPRCASSNVGHLDARHPPPPNLHWLAQNSAQAAAGPVLFTGGA